MTLPQHPLIPPIRRVNSLASAFRHAGDVGNEGMYAIALAYDVTSRHQAPLVVIAADRMLRRTRESLAEAPGQQVVCVDRDGRPYAIAMSALDPDLFNEHGKTTIITRGMLELALIDAEANGFDTADAQIFRHKWTRREIDAQDIPGAHARLRRHVERDGVILDRQGQPLRFVDSSLRGGVQTSMGVLFPNTPQIGGEYAILRRDPRDVRAAGKVGHILHGIDEIDAAGTRRAVAATRDTAFYAPAALRLLEHPLNGTAGPVTRFTDDGVVQALGRDDPYSTTVPIDDPLASYRNPLVREAVKLANQLAVEDLAVAVARIPVDEREAQLAGGLTAMFDQAWAWASGGELEADFATVNEAFVARDRDIHALVREAQSGEHGARPE